MRFEHYLVTDALKLTKEYLKIFTNRAKTLRSIGDAAYLLGFMADMLLELSIEIRLKAVTASKIANK